jgi:hypothetical protein
MIKPVRRVVDHGLIGTRERISGQRASTFGDGGKLSQLTAAI